MPSSTTSPLATTRPAVPAARRAHPVRALVALARPAAVVGAVAVVLAGHAAAPPAEAGALAWLLAAAAALGLAAALLGGAFADLGSGAPRTAASAVAGLLMAGATLAALQVSLPAGWLAATTAAAAAAALAGLVRRAWLGPPLAGTAVAGLYLLGTAGAPPAAAAISAAALAPFCYGAAFAVLARGGAWHGDRRPAYLALALVLLAVLLPLTLGWDTRYSGLSALPFALVLAWQVLPDVAWAASDPRPVPVHTALATGGIAAPALAAAVTAGFSGMLPGLFVLALLPAAGLLERLWGDR
ncbi:hypothetical protein [Azospirillum sp. ST 5-10]|uniref:hypothetical protein n=1 Tax=unclassified Azospirillum TaxID=2630922 RepID=UPI003F4A51F1